MSKLTSHVHVTAEDGFGSVVFGPDDEVPEWAARQMGAHCFEDGDHPFPDEDGDDVTDRAPGAEPPRNGAGSGLDSWVAFAREKGQDDITTDWKRDAVITALVERELIAE